jgi:hypothetical protein
VKYVQYVLAGLVVCMRIHLLCMLALVDLASASCRVSSKLLSMLPAMTVLAADNALVAATAAAPAAAAAAAAGCAGMSGGRVLSKGPSGMTAAHDRACN